jgi:hypothetical protein
VATRAHVLGQLQRELLHARDARADAYAQELEQEIARLSAGTPENPVRETLAAGKSGEVTHGAVRPRRPRTAR